MAFSANRAGFVKQETRYYEASDATVLAKFPTARSMVIDASVDEATAIERGNALLAELKHPFEVLRVSIIGVYHASDFAGHGPRFTCDFHSVKNDTTKTYFVSAVEVDELNNTTVLELIG